MILYGLSFIIFLFVSFSLLFRAKISAWIKLPVTVFIFFVSMKYVIYQLIGGAFFSPELPREFILVMEALYGAFLLLFFLLLLWDLYLLINWLVSKTGLSTHFIIPAGWIKLALAVIALGAGIWGTWETIRVPDVRTVSIKTDKLPCSMNGFKVVQLTDLHVGPILKKDWLEKVVKKVNEQHPDLVVLTGDYIDGHVDIIGQEIEPLAHLESKYGIFAVTGNHEYYWNVTEWEEAIKNLGITWLNNSHKILNLPDADIVLLGIPDSHSKRFGFEEPNLEKALKDAPEGLRLLLSHQPKNAAANLREIDMQFSGHTHGGIMFFLQPLIAAFNGGFVNGLYDIDQKKLYVSPGTGLWNGFSCRIGVPAEITSFVFSCNASKASEK